MVYQKQFGFKGNFANYLKSRIFSWIVELYYTVALSVASIISGITIASLSSSAEAGNTTAVIGIIGSFIYGYYKAYKYLERRVKTKNAYIKLLLTDIIINYITNEIYNNPLHHSFGRKTKKRRSRRSRKV